ncbi:response regulator [Nitrosopumilus sp. Nsub]|uniref:response regulator n=1 Tax=Nitrosopumilus sp. Nsub TaxID=1776294 RepID=UPI000833AD02|nr:response regulator [Nitrosopumilus sp. Nsub]
MKILIAEDEEDISNQYKLVLEGKGHKVTLTENGKVCADEFAANPDFDCVVLDYKMPVMDGFEAAKSILNVNPKQRIIFASAYVDKTLEESILKLKRLTEIIRKPFDLDVLSDTIEDVTCYEELEKLNLNSEYIKNGNPTHEQLMDLIDGVKKLSKGRI